MGTKSEERLTPRIRLGNDDPRKAIPKPKHWSYITPSEGRKGKGKRVKEVKLQHCFVQAKWLLEHLLRMGVGTPECKWKISTNSPFRDLTSRDVCYVLQSLQFKIAMKEQIEIRMNGTHRILIIEDCSECIKSEAKDEMQPKMMNS